MKKQKIIISVLMLIIFSIQTYGQRADSDSINQVELETILKKCAEYCDKVKKVALSFTCAEIIESKKYFYRKGATLIINAFGDIPEVHNFNVRDLKLQKIVKDKFIYEYRLVKKDSTIEENRTLLQRNRRKKYKENAEL